jgi:oligopeptidase B
MAPTETLQQRLYDEFVARLKQTDVTASYPYGPFSYYTRTVEGKDYPIYCRRHEDRRTPEQVFLDVNDLAQAMAADYLRVAKWEASRSGARLAYTTDTTGYEEATLRFRALGVAPSDVRDLPGTIEHVSPWSIAWAGDDTVFYCRMDDAKRDHRVYRHTLGTDPATDELVFEETDPRFRVGVRLSRSGELVLISSESRSTSEVWMIPAGDPTAEPRVVRPRETGVRYSVDHRVGDGGGTLYILTDRDAPNFKLVTAPVADPAAWTTLLEHDPALYRQRLVCLEKHYAVQERAGGYTRIIVDRYEGGDRVVIDPQDEVGVVSMNTNHQYGYRYLRYTDQSPVRPAETIEWDLYRKITSLRKREEIGGGFDPARYTTARDYATAPDGTRIPVSIVHRVDVSPTGDNPCHLYAYGSYGSSMDPWFSSARISLLDRGFVCAIAHVRGGGEMGRHWVEDGKLEHKMNTFTDFIAVAERLIDEGWTSPDRLAIEGGSAGGLLIGAVLNLRPDLFAAAHAAVPFVDCLNTMLDPSIPLTTEEYEEWGNPEEPEAYRVIKSYAPYENVAALDYPALLVTAGLNDPRVHYWEPAKWVARLRDLKTGDAPLILKTNMGAGHGGSSGRYGRLAEKAYEWAFLVSQVAPSHSPTTN